MTTERMLQTVGKRTFVNCFCFKARKKKGMELNEVDVMNADSRYSKEWKDSSLATKTSTFNGIFRENRQCDALKMCCESRVSNKEKAKGLYKKYC